jgi:hypothetical protein
MTLAKAKRGPENNTVKESAESEKNDFYTFLKRTGGYALGGLCIFAVYLAVQLFGRSTQPSLLFLLADGLTITAVLLLIFTGLQALNHNGMLDWAAYMLYQARFLLMHKKDHEYENFFAFRKLRKRSSASLLPGVYAAALYMAAGMAFSFLVV